MGLADGHPTGVEAPAESMNMAAMHPNSAQSVTSAANLQRAAIVMLLLLVCVGVVHVGSAFRFIALWSRCQAGDDQSVSVRAGVVDPDVSNVHVVRVVVVVGFILDGNVSVRFENGLQPLDKYADFHGFLLQVDDALVVQQYQQCV
jgi:hypothetical protein